VAAFSENHRRSGAKSSLSEHYAAADGRAVFDKGIETFPSCFSDHSLATDSVFAEVQLVACRNVLIYFNREFAGPGRWGLFRESLCHGGFLWLGLGDSLRFSAWGGRVQGSSPPPAASSRKVGS